MTILIVNAVEWGPEHQDSDFPKDVAQWIGSAFGGGAEQFEVLNAQRESPALDGSWEGIILSGSAASVYDGHPWIERLSEAIRHWAAHEIPILGICFGHQMIAHAFGGRVIKNPKGWELGTLELDVNDAGMDDPLFEGLPRRFKVMESHQDIVAELPPKAECLASTEACACQSMRIGANIRSVQFHPEYTVEQMRFLIGPRRPRLEASGVDVDAVVESLSPTPSGATILANFGRLLIHPSLHSPMESLSNA